MNIPEQRASVLPSSGQVSLKALADIIATAPNRLGSLDEVEVRSVLVIADGIPVNAATVLRVGFDPSPPSLDTEVRRVGDLVLIHARIRATSIHGEKALRETLGIWPSMLGIDRSIDFQDNLYCAREPSANGWNADPIWVATAYDRSPAQHPPVPRGAFYDPNNRFVAESLRGAAHQWLRTPMNVDSVANDYHILLRDPRVQLGSRDLEMQASSDNEGELVLRVSTTLPSTERVDVAVICTGFEGFQRRSIHVLQSNDIRVRISLPVRDIEVWAFSGTTGEWFDYFRDSDQARSGNSILAPKRSATDPGYAALLAALESGECDIVEFKTFLPIERKRLKSIELLKTVVAFANTSGGSLLIGISDDAEIVGVPGALLRAQGLLKGQDDAALRAAYADRIRRIVGEGVHPTLSVGLEWLEHAGLHVLRVVVPQSGLAPHQIAENGDYYERRGGTSRRGLPERFLLRTGSELNH